MGVFLQENAIVGIDPGVTTAVAILSLRGEVLKIKSSRDFSLRKILKFVSKECTPVVIASDVFPAPRLAEKAAASFSVPLHTPHESLSKKSKARLVSPFELKGLVRHKRDALAAAVCAYGSIVPMLKKIQNRLYKNGLLDTGFACDLAGKIITRKISNIDKAVRNLPKNKSSE